MIDVQQIEVWMHGRQVGRLALTPQRPRGKLMNDGLMNDGLMNDGLMN